MLSLTSKDCKNHSIPDFYAGKSVFITGGTGFIGKVFIEKLLYSCPNIEKIYMLTREKKGISIIQRTNRFLDDPLFQRLKDERPSDFDKIVAIPGDIASPNLGITADDEKILLVKVSIIVHLAATVKFSEHLSIAWNINVEGTQNVLSLSRKMKQLEAFVHVSTAYTNVNREVVDEILYPPPADINDVYKYVKEGVTEEQTEKILNGYPNTYTFSKALAEQVVAQNQAYVPTIIVRPSIVGAVKDAPIRGWLANWFGATGLAVFTARGLNRVVYGDRNNRLDLIPVDYVTNLMIIAAARSTNELNVYNCCSSSCNPITIKKVVDLFRNEIYNQKQTMPLPGLRWCIYTRYKWMATFLTILIQLIPAFVADIYRRLIWKTPRYMKLYNILIRTRAVLDFFSSHSWVMKADRVRELYASLSRADQRTFPCDPADIKWVDYIKDYYLGVRQLEGRN